MFKRRKSLALAAAATSAVLVASGCGGGGDESGGGEREVTWVIETLPGAWQSISSAGGSVYVIQTLSGILPSTGGWLPDAVTYEYDMDVLAEEPTLINDDLDEGPFEFSFTLADDAVWSDGEPMTGEDLRVTWMMSAGPAEGYCNGCDSRLSTNPDQVEDIEVDGKTATVTLKEGQANAEWMGLFDSHSVAGGFLPAHLAEENGLDVDDPDDLGEYFAWMHSERPEWSGGPYQIVSGDLENEVVKEPNPEWFGDEPGLDRITFMFNTDEGTFVNAFSNGEIDGGSPSSYNEDVFTQIDELQNATTTIGEGAAWEHVDLNLNNEALQDVELRRAIFTAIDRDEIASRNYGAGYPDYELKNNHIFGNDSPYFVDHFEGESQGTGDVDAATEILEEAGYEVGDTLTLDGDEVGPFRLRSTDSVVRNTSLQLIQAQLSEIGITTNIEVTDDLGGMLAEADYDIAQFGWQGNPYFVTSGSQYWGSDSGSNFGAYSNDDVDELTDEAANAPDLDTAADHMNEAMESLVPEAYVLPIMHEPYYSFVNSDRLAGVEDNLHSSYRATYNIGEWTLAD
ncbi:ABC transporter family substrate-binding protein [Nocardiopsis sp. MG754419]|uniref:ABC transporter family substrate-binding protein n=1 Tax=Nocardiopsis sp. MG754419 TaxID=2259865 RepID=UPI001BA711EF|nr:ABC transporter family substrate-binding protein [Nocardiopsis sp. MG754419]